MSEQARRMLAGVPEMYRPLVGELLESLGATLGKATEALGQGDAAGAADAAHRLKGACMYYGLGELASLAARAQDSARAGDAAGAGASLKEFRATLEALRQVV